MSQAFATFGEGKSRERIHLFPTCPAMRMDIKELQYVMRSLPVRISDWIGHLPQIQRKELPSSFVLTRLSY